MAQFEKLQKKIFGKKILNVTTVKLFSNKKINTFMGFFDAFLFQPLIKGKKITIVFIIFQNSVKNKRFLQIGT